MLLRRCHIVELPGSTVEQRPARSERNRMRPLDWEGRRFLNNLEVIVCREHVNTLVVLLEYRHATRVILCNCAEDTRVPVSGTIRIGSTGSRDVIAACAVIALVVRGSNQ